MANEKIMKARVVHKHDTEANWNIAGAAGFIPKHGEIIFYDKDNNHAYVRQKIGNGISSVNKLPFSFRDIAYTGNYNDLINTPISTEGVVSVPLVYKDQYSGQEIFRLNCNSTRGELNIHDFMQFNSYRDSAIEGRDSVNFSVGELNYSLIHEYSPRELYDNSSSKLKLGNFELNSYENHLESQKHDTLKLGDLTIETSKDYNNAKTTLSITDTFEVGNDGKAYLKIGDTILYESVLQKLIALLEEPDTPDTPDVTENYAMYNGEYLTMPNGEYLVIGDLQDTPNEPDSPEEPDDSTNYAVYNNENLKHNNELVII